MINSNADFPNVDELSGNKVLRVEECYAKEVLGELDVSKFGKLQFNECPDLIDRGISVGVEVTQATSEDERHAEGIFSRIINKQDGVITQEQERKIKRLGSEYSDGILIGPARWASEKQIVKACEAKLEKLNGRGYESLSSYHLFIVCDDSLTSYVADGALKEIGSLYECFEKRFDSVFVSDRFEPNRLLELNIGTNTWRMHTFDYSASDSFWRKAWHVIKCNDA